MAALRLLFDWLVVGQVVPTNPAAAVKGPKRVTRTGKTPVLEGEQARALFESIETDTVKGLLIALIGFMAYSFGRIGAVAKLRGEGGPRHPAHMATRTDRRQRRFTIYSEQISTAAAAEKHEPGLKID